MMDQRAKTRYDRKQFLYELQNYLNGLNADGCFFAYSFHVSFLRERLVVLLVQQKTGITLKIHNVIGKAGHSTVEHFTLYEDPSLARLSTLLSEAALVGIIFQGLNVLFFLAAYQQLSHLSFYLWHEEAERLNVAAGFFKERTSLGHYIRFKMPTKTNDYDNFIAAAQKNFMLIHDKLWRFRKNDKQVGLFLQTKGFFKNTSNATHLSLLHLATIQSEMVEFSRGFIGDQHTKKQ